MKPTPESAFFKGIEVGEDIRAAISILKLPADKSLDTNWAEFYEAEPRMMPSKKFVFMNHGYASEGKDDFTWLKKEDLSQKYHLNLIRHLIAHLDLSNKTVLDVGCGRGGTCSFLNRYYDPKHLFGVDLSRANIAFCERVHRVKRISFLQGDAQDLPFKSLFFDMVINVESSHCYSSLHRFFKEVWRVLKRRGKFCYADAIVKSAVGRREEMLAKQGFRIIRRQDITKNVALAIGANARNLEKFFRSMIRSRKNEAFIENLLRGINKNGKRAYASRNCLYMLWVLSKP